MPRAILLIDMDAFFASVEQARRPELRGRPVIVGGRAEGRGVVSTASYEARACGVRTAMPMAQALRRCPQGVFLPVDMAAYKAVQQQLLAIYGRFTDLVEPVSIDEAFLDVTGSRRLFGSPQEIAGQIQRLTREELGLSCSIGIGPTRLLAKLAAELDKPGGLTTLTQADVHGRLRSLPVGAISGIGPVTVKRLSTLGVTSIGELQDAPLPLLETSFAKAATSLKELAFGGGEAPVRAGDMAPKSMGSEVTFARDTAAPEFLQATLLDLADKVASDLRRQGYAGRTAGPQASRLPLSHGEQAAHTARADEHDAGDLRGRPGAPRRSARARPPPAPPRPHAEWPDRSAPDGAGRLSARPRLRRGRRSGAGATAPRRCAAPVVDSRSIATGRALPVARTSRKTSLAEIEAPGSSRITGSARAALPLVRSGCGKGGGACQYPGRRTSDAIWMAFARTPKHRYEGRVVARPARDA